jgi:hypothetical protein
MILDEVKPITRTEAEAGLTSGIPDKICDALIRITYHDPDWRWVQDMCLELASHSDPQVSGLAVTCLGHLARIHGFLDVEKVLPTLRRLRDDPKISGRVADALDDIKMYLECDFNLE